MASKLPVLSTFKHGWSNNLEYFVEGCKQRAHLSTFFSFQYICRVCTLTGKSWRFRCFLAEIWSSGVGWLASCVTLTTNHTTWTTTQCCFSPQVLTQQRNKLHRPFPVHSKQLFFPLLFWWCVVVFFTADRRLQRACALSQPWRQPAAHVWVTTLASTSSSASDWESSGSDGWSFNKSVHPPQSSPPPFRLRGGGAECFRGQSTRTRRDAATLRLVPVCVSGYTCVINRATSHVSLWSRRKRQSNRQTD